MRWSERQRAMLGAMGVTIWAPPGTETLDPPPLPPRTPTPQHAVTGRATTQRATTQQAEPPKPSRMQAGDAEARGARIAALDWPALRAEVAQCTACRLCEGRTQTVFGVGHQQAHCMIVGEAPGEQEDRLGEPFVGAAGQLLDRMLLAIGLTRGDAPPAQQVYIANTLKCRPPRNRNPEPDELAQCSAFLMRQIALIQPRIIVAMGRFAVQSLLNSNEPIGKLRARVHAFADRPLVVTYHPAYLLRNPADKARSWADLCLAASLLSR